MRSGPVYGLADISPRLLDDTVTKGVGVCLEKMLYVRLIEWLKEAE